MNAVELAALQDFGETVMPYAYVFRWAAPHGLTFVK
jgi:hypothetical protein